MSWKDCFKSDQQKHKEDLQMLQQNKMSSREAFIKAACDAEFSTTQAEFMFQYLTLVGHVHEYRNGIHDRVTSEDLGIVG